MSVLTHGIVEFAEQHEWRLQGPDGMIFLYGTGVSNRRRANFEKAQARKAEEEAYRAACIVMSLCHPLVRAHVFTTPLGRSSRPRASTRYACSDPWAATAALGDGKIHGPSLGGGIMYQNRYILSMAVSGITAQVPKEREKIGEDWRGLEKIGEDWKRLEI
jgi:hypothetical protein